MLQPFGPEIWLSDGAPIKAALGFHYPTRMAVMRFLDGSVAIWSPTALTPEGLEEIQQLGPIYALIAPNGLHHMHLADWVCACPDAEVVAVPSLEKKRRDLLIDTFLTETGYSLWPGEIDHVILETRITSEAVFFHHASGTVLFTDLLQQMPRTWYKGWRSWVARLDLMTEDEPTEPRKFRIAISERDAARRRVDTILDWPIQQVVMAHGIPVTEDAQAFLKRAFQWL